MRYDRDGDSHYDILSAFQKSIRGSDPDAAVHYLARLVSAGDLPSICRRLLVISAEDIGLAYPQAISVVKACVDSAMQLGFPEARIPLAEAVILLATAPKSNSAITAIDSALSDIEGMDTGDIPEHLKDSHYGGAKKLGHGTEYNIRTVMKIIMSNSSICPITLGTLNITILGTIKPNSRQKLIGTDKEKELIYERRICKMCKRNC